MHRLVQKKVNEAGSKGENGIEYGKLKQHTHIKSICQKDDYMVPNTVNKVFLSMKYQNRQIKVILEFPEQSDPKVEQEFISRLKAIYLEKMKHRYELRSDILMKIGAGQESGLALSSLAAKDKEENGNA